MPLTDKKSRILYIFFGFFVANAVVAELISVKLFDFGECIGLESNTYIMALGLLPWPIVFLATDALNEFYGKKIVRQLSFFTSGLLLYVFLIVYIADNLNAFEKAGVTNEEFSKVFSQSGYLIIGSVIAFLVGQLTDIFFFGVFKRITKGKYIWLRATGSTAISQLVDTIIVIGIGFYLPGKVSFDQYMNMIMTGYFIKLIFAIVLTPLIYLVHYMMKKMLHVNEINYEKA